MNRTSMIPLAALFAMGLLACGAYAQDGGSGQGSGQGLCNFIDEDGDGFNDLAPDDDGDGIPNGLDPDYVRPEDGTGRQLGWGRYAQLFQKVFGAQMMGYGPGEPGYGQGEMGYGPGEGTGLGEGPGEHTGGPEDGSFGPGSGDGTGDGVDEGGRAQRRGGQR
jgi:hypothetical protein